MADAAQIPNVSFTSGSPTLTDETGNFPANVYVGMNLNDLDRMHEFVDRILDPVPVFLNWTDFRLVLSRGL